MPLLFNFILEYDIRRVQINQDGLKLNCTHRLLVCANDVNVLGRSVHSIQGFWWGNRRERNHFGDPGIDGRIILRRIFRKWDVRA